MILLIAGTSRTGKTILAQKLLERMSYPYLSVDHLKMGLIRAGMTGLTPESAEKDLTGFLWPVVREMIKTNIENHQNLILEGCYIPFDFAASFPDAYLDSIRYLCLIFSPRYIRERFDDILGFESTIEKRGNHSAPSAGEMIAANEHNLKMCRKYGLNYILIDEPYDIDRYAEKAIELFHHETRSF